LKKTGIGTEEGISISRVQQTVGETGLSAEFLDHERGKKRLRLSREGHEESKNREGIEKGRI